jgi:hypothetical protein
MIPSFHHIRNAILAVGKRPSGFPYGSAFTPEHRAALRSAPHLQAFLSDLRAAASRTQSEPITELTFDAFRCFERTGTRREYERPYFARRARLAALALVALIDEDDAYLPTLNETIWSICNEYTWCLPAHLGRVGDNPGAGRLSPDQAVDLFAAETAHALAETLSLLGERLDPWLRYRIRTEIERRIIRPLFYDPVHFWWEAAPMNWAAVCAGACGMAALLLEEDSERLAGMIDRCVRAMECFLEGFGDDGGCAEGVGYWQYGFGYYVYFADMLYEYTVGRIDLFDGERIRRIASFPAAVSLGKGHFVNYSDGAAQIDLRPGLMSRLAMRVAPDLPPLRGVPAFDADACYRWAHISRDLIWTDPTILDRPTPIGTVFLDHLGWVIDRRNVRGVLLAFSARAGHNGEPHNQNDLGHFILHIGGDSLLADLGAGVYTRQYFGPERYEHIHNSSEGHSVPLIDGHPQLPGADHTARVVRCEPTADGVMFEIDLTRAYGAPLLRELRRVFDWRCDAGAAQARLILDDYVRCDAAPGSFEERFVSLHEPEMAPGVIVWRGARGSMTMRYDDGAFDAFVDRIASHDHDGTPITIRRVRLCARALQAEMTCRVVFECSVES